MRRHRLLALTLLLGASSPLRADEGMWLFNAFPADQVQKAHGFKPDPAFLDHIRLASARFNNGGSASFVSSRGMLITNHHVGRDCIAKLSSPERDLEKQGFLARSVGEELRCPDLEVNVLVGLEDVTSAVRAAEQPGASDAENNRARREKIIALEQACTASTGLRCDVVTLFGGGAYHLYRYKRYQDVRLAFAPEQQAAFFGGDIDNFEYPRYNLDIALFRAYEEGAPAATPAFLPINPNGVRDNELVFVSGHPGKTQRDLTLAQLDFMRELAYPFVLDRWKELEARLGAYATSSPEAARHSQAFRYAIANNRKRFNALYEGVKSEERMGPKRRSEKDFRQAIARHPDGAKWAPAFDRLASAQAIHRDLYFRHQLLENFARGVGGKLIVIARHLVRLADETPKPNEKRLPEYTDAAMPSLKQGLFSTAPIYREMEAVVLEVWIERLVRHLGSSDPLVQAILQGRSPKEAAAALVAGTRLDTIEARKTLFEGGAQAVAASSDTMIQLARAIDAEARAIRQRYEDEVESVEKDSSAKLTAARFALYGPKQFPDATFTLRMSYGRVKGYREDGKSIRFQTDFAGMFARAAEKGEKPPFDLPPRWKQATALKRTTQFNFVAGLDTTGGNSGSPLVNTKGELVGVNFDSNRHKIANDLVYAEERARNVSVSAAGIVEALRSVYQADTLLEELLPAAPAGRVPASEGSSTGRPR